ncbi:hypothetical protein [Roseospirillum parvum]|uniref:Uncharacterized protein n=1 Tax=Roseospirillum parvum TaxID=83401 RepID=A0A1G8FBQ2_9PROT|nr:hypothetical protein [Roseospirillum parvum]SDH79550.1 hypothetical protein SAMN05421742_11322 [Roseospirillum parvum]
MGDRGREFAELVHNLLVVRKLVEVQAAADGLSLSYHALHARISGRTPFSADEIRSLVAMLPDGDLLRYFTRNTDLLVLDRRDFGQQEGLGDLRGSAVRTMIEATDILKAVHEALADGRLDHLDRGRIGREVDACERALAGIRHLLEPANGHSAT